MANEKLKQNLETLLIECFNKAKENNFKDLNFVFPKFQPEKKFFKTRLEILKHLDVYSRTFLEIHTRAKIALREFQQYKFDGQYLELLRSVLTLSERIKPPMKSARVYTYDEIQTATIGEEITVKQNYKPKLIDTKILKQGIKGKTISNKKQKLKTTISELEEIEFADTKNEINDLTF